MQESRASPFAGNRRFTDLRKPQTRIFPIRDSSPSLSLSSPRSRRARIPEGKRAFENEHKPEGSCLPSWLYRHKYINHILLIHTSRARSRVTSIRAKSGLHGASPLQRYTPSLPPTAPPRLPHYFCIKRTWFPYFPCRRVNTPFTPTHKSSLMRLTARSTTLLFSLSYCPSLALSLSFFLSRIDNRTRFCVACTRSRKSPIQTTQQRGLLHGTSLHSDILRERLEAAQTRERERAQETQTSRLEKERPNCCAEKSIADNESFTRKTQWTRNTERLPRKIVPRTTHEEYYEKKENCHSVHRLSFKSHPIQRRKRV